MRIFALETNNEKLANSLVTKGEEILLHIRFHPFLFAMRSLLCLLYTLVIAAVAIGIWVIGVPALVSFGIAFAFWFFLVFLRFVTAFIDWQYDVLLLTTEKLVVVNQTSIIRRQIRQMNLENIATVNVETQYGNILPFGILAFDLKEGVGQSLTLKFIPHAPKVGAVINDALVAFEHRRHA
jgi:hypothetical protein